MNINTVQAVHAQEVGVFRSLKNGKSGGSPETPNTTIGTSQAIKLTMLFLAFIRFGILLPTGKFLSQ